MGQKVEQGAYTDCASQHGALHFLAPEQLVKYTCVSHEQRIDIRIPLLAVPFAEGRRVRFEIAASRGSPPPPLAAKMLAV